MNTLEKLSSFLLNFDLENVENYDEKLIDVVHAASQLIFRQNSQQN